MIKVHIYFVKLQDNIYSIFTNQFRAVQLSAQGHIAGKNVVNPDPSASKAYPSNQSRDGKQILPHGLTLIGWYGYLEAMLRSIRMP